MKTILKTSVAAAALMAVAAPAMAQNLAREAGRDKVKLTIYGQVNKAVMWGDDGATERTMIVDNAVSSTRWGFIAAAPLTADVTLGAQIETEILSNASNSVSIGSSSSPSQTTTLDNGVGAVNGNSATFIERVMEVTVDHKRFGKLSLGQGSEAGDGITENNLTSATNVVGFLAYTAFGSNFRLWDSTTRDYSRATTLGAAASYFDPGRDDRIRYDSPKFMNTWVSGSFTSGGRSRASIRHDAKYGQFKVVAGLGYNNNAGLNTSAEDEVAGSIAVLHDSGLNAFFAAGERNNKLSNSGGVASDARRDGEFIGGGIGYIAKIFGVGPTAFAADWINTENNTALTVETGQLEATRWGIGVEQHFSDYGASAYLGYSNYDVDVKNTPTISFDDVNIVIAGMRVVF